MNQTVVMAATLMLLAACMGAPRLRRNATEPQDGGAATASRARVALQDVRFDGQALHGRLLVTAEEGNVLLDKRLIESIVLTTESVVECETGRRLSFLEMDVLARLPQNEDLLLLEPGYWYGKDVRIPLFTPGLNGAEVACIEAEFTFHPREGGAASLRVRSELPASTLGDAGTANSLPVPDAGVGVTGP